MVTFDPDSPAKKPLEEFLAKRRQDRAFGTMFDPRIGFSLAGNATTGMWRVHDYETVRMALKGGMDVPARVTSVDQLTFINADATLGPTRPVCPTAGGILYMGLQGSVQITAGGDPPLHTDTVDAFRAFPRTPSQVRDLAIGIRGRADALARGLYDRQHNGTVDLLADFAVPLTVGVIASPELIGIPAEREADIKEWSDGQLYLLWGNDRRGPHPTAACDDRCRLEIQRAEKMVRFWEYCMELVAGKPRPGSFMYEISQFTRANGEKYTPQELASFPFNLLVAGQESTSALLATTVAVLLSVPGLFEAAGKDRNLLMNCIWEVLRLWPAFYNWIRKARTDINLGTSQVKAGDLLLLGLAAANLEPTQFPAPEVFSPWRNNHKMITSFGLGAHSCPGMNLSILEVCIAVEVLAEYIQGLATQDELEFQASDVFLCFKKLPIILK